MISPLSLRYRLEQHGGGMIEADTGYRRGLARACYEDHLAAHGFMDLQGGVDAILVAAQAHIHQHDPRPVFLREGDRLVCGASDAADRQPHVFDLNTQRLGYQELVIDH